MKTKFEELTALDFRQAVKKAKGVCLLPFGILEKHGPHLPLGTDLFHARDTALRAADREYTIVFPEYYFGQIFEAKHQPGTIAYSAEVMMKLLQETCEELARNGLKKIIIVNGHGGNRFFLHYFCQMQMEKKRDYAVVLFRPEWATEEAQEKTAKIGREIEDGHGGMTETSMIQAFRPDLVQPDRAGEQSGEDLARLGHLPHAFTGIWWYAKYPNHYSGDAEGATPELGDIVLDSHASQLVQLIRALKKDDALLHLQDKFFKESENPFETEQ